MSNNSLWSRLKSGLSRSAEKLSTGLTDLFTKRKLDDAALEQLEDVLLAADLGPKTAAALVAELSRTRFGKEVDEAEIKNFLAEQLTLKLSPFAGSTILPASPRPYVVVMVGVNGTGKTTSMGKLAQYYKNQGLKVLLAAGDTFRAAATEQLQQWGAKVGVPVISGATEGDAASVAFTAVQEALRGNSDIVLIDTAGRLHNKEHLMAELQKMIRAIAKALPGAPHAVWLTLDATTGQNALQQVAVFKELVQVSGLIVTKLDGSAKGGVLVALTEAHKLPVLAIGVGESAADLQPFVAADFAKALVGL